MYYCYKDGKSRSGSTKYLSLVGKAKTKTGLLRKVAKSTMARMKNGKINKITLNITKAESAAKAKANIAKKYGWSRTRGGWRRK